MSTMMRNRGGQERRLESTHQELVELAQAFHEEAGLDRPISEAAGDVLALDFEDADLAQALLDRETNGRLISLLDENREQVERALERLAAGTYGACEDCGREIPHERLRVRPEATRCVDCQGRWERLHRTA